MRTRTFLILPLLALACGEKAPSVPPAREPVAIRYVAADELPIHQAKDEASPVISTFQIGAPVSVLADQGDWSEVRITFDSSGWVRRDQLSDTPPGDIAASGGGSSTPRFRVPPAQVFSPGRVSGEIVLEADVNTDGEVTGVRAIANTTGRADLEAKNVEELRKAKFYPLVIGGARKTFIYEHRISY